MKRIMQHLICFLICLLLSSFINAKQNKNIPLIVWSDEGTTQASTKYLTKKYNVAGIYNLLSDSKSPLFKTDSKEGSRIVYVFVLDHLQIEDVDSKLLEHLKASKLSFVAQNTVRENDVSSLIDSFHQMAKRDSSIIVTTVQEFSSFYNKLPENGNKIVVVPVPDERKMEDVMHLIKQYSMKSAIYYAVTADSNVNTRTTRMLASEGIDVTNETKNNISFCPDGSFYNDDPINGNFCFSHYVYITPSIITGIVIGFILAATAYIGFSALNDIQTPLRYPSTAPSLGKEF